MNLLIDRCPTALSQIYNRKSIEKLTFRAQALRWIESRDSRICLHGRVKAKILVAGNMAMYIKKLLRIEQRLLI